MPVANALVTASVLGMMRPAIEGVWRRRWRTRRRPGQTRGMSLHRIHCQPPLPPRHNLRTTLLGLKARLFDALSNQILLRRQQAPRGPPDENCRWSTSLPGRGRNAAREVLQCCAPWIHCGLRRTGKRRCDARTPRLRPDPSPPSQGAPYLFACVDKHPAPPARGAPGLSSPAQPGYAAGPSPASSLMRIVASLRQRNLGWIINISTMPRKASASNRHSEADYATTWLPRIGEAPIRGGASG